MRVSIIVEDRSVVVDGVGIAITSGWPTTPDDIWAYQWYNDHGVKEYIDTGKLNEEFADISEIQSYIDVHSTTLTQIELDKQVAITTAVYQP